jgi:hypothetical protein
MLSISSERRKLERRKGIERRKNIDPQYKEPGKNRRVHQDRRSGERRKNISAFVTCRECGNMFLITKDDFHKMTLEDKPVYCPRGCKKDNTKIAKTSLFMIERGKR